MSETAVAARDDFSAHLADTVRRAIPGATGIAHLKRLSGGASQETWSFEATGNEPARKLILRRAPGGDRVHDRAAGLEIEAELIRLAREAGVPEPRVMHVLEPADGVGRGFIVEFLEGETLGRKIVRDEIFAEARKTLAHRCGEVMAKIHSLPLHKLPRLRTATAQQRHAELYSTYKTAGTPRPVFALAFEWLRAHFPLDPPVKLVHGDFRNGNLIVGPDGLRAVLDWELAHLGDPVEDLGWICIAPWRFSGEGPAGGFGTREQLVAGYEAGGGGKVSLEHLKWWEVLGSLSWGVSCGAMFLSYRSGVDRTVERAMIARRASENEIDLLNLLAPRS